MNIRCVCIALLGFAIVDVEAACSSQEQCMHVSTHACNSNFERVVCMYWDKTKPECSNPWTAFNNACVSGDRARKWFQGEQTKRCSIVNNDNLSVEFGVRGTSACAGTASFDTFYNNNVAHKFTASCAPQTSEAPCRRVRHGNRAGFCVWTVTAPMCDGSIVERMPTKLPTKQPIKSPTKLPTKFPSKLPSKLPTKLPSKAPVARPTAHPTQLSGDGRPTHTTAPAACSNVYGCTTEMLTNNYCDLKCDIPECFNDNYMCGGYVHIELSGSWADIDPKVYDVVTNVVAKLNSVIKPEAMENYPLRGLYHGVCGYDTSFPGDPDDVNQDGSVAYPDTYQTKQLIVVARLADFDGTWGQLGYGGPCGYGTREGSWDTAYTTYGQITLDRADVANMLLIGQSGKAANLETLIMHEVGHAIGIGTLWGNYGLVADRRWDSTGETNNLPKYTGLRGNAQYIKMGGVGLIPVEEDGGYGTADSHWDNDKFQNELMTGWLSGSPVLSALTLGSFEDMGIAVDMSKADDYVLPEFRTSNFIGLRAAKQEQNLIPFGHDIVYPEYVEVTHPDGTTEIVAANGGLPPHPTST